MVQQSEHHITIGIPIVGSICMGRALYDLSNNVLILGPTITILIYFKRIYDCLPKYIKFVVLGPVMGERSSNKIGHILPRMSGNQNICTMHFDSMISP